MTRPTNVANPEDLRRMLSVGAPMVFFKQKVVSIIVVPRLRAEGGSASPSFTVCC